MKETISTLDRAPLSRRSFVRNAMAAVAAPTFLGCGGVADPTPPPQSAGNPRLTARPGQPSITPAAGSSPLGIGSGSRDGQLYVPTAYTPDTPIPLLVLLHGATGQGSNWGNYIARAEARNMALLTPDSRGTTWDLIRGGFGPDVTFLDSALAHTFDRVRVDPSRVLFGGFSDGASYALSLGVSNGDLFTHLVGFSPGFLLAFDPIIGKPRVYVSHGTNDGILSVQQSRDVIVPGLEDLNYDVTYSEFDGGHTIPATIAEEALDWFEA